MIDIVFASKNNHKVREIKEIISEAFKLDCSVYSLSINPKYEPPEETGSSFEENALIKARDAHKHFKNQIILADDSGLVVPALNGEPGVFSARYAGEAKNNAKNREKLLKNMSSFTGEQERQAYFQAVIAMIFPDGEEFVFTGICEGHLLYEEKGGNGFGYDSLFVKHDYDKSFAELSDQVKNKISHRRKALDQALLHLEKNQKKFLSELS